MRGLRAFLVASALLASALHASAVTHYVREGWTNPVSPYTNWITASANIHDALVVSANGDEVAVTNGNYMGYFPAFLVTNSVAVRSINGASFTVVNGGHAVRGFYLANTGAVVEGFNIINGRWDSGGGAYVEAGALRHCWFSGCTATNSSGGAVYVAANGAVEHCVLTGNTAMNSGGGCYNAGGTVEGVFAQGNQATYHGGGFVSEGGVLRSCVAIGNSVTFLSAEGGGIWLHGGALAQNCTAVGNSAIYGGGLYNESSAVLNSILFGNSAALEHADYNGIGSPTIDYSCLGHDEGANNFTNNPQFRNAAGGDYRLRTNSPCIDRGTNSAWMTAGRDADWTPRLGGSRVDVGAYEFQIAYAAPGGSNTPPYNTWAKAATNIQDAVNVCSNGYTVIVSNGNYRATSALSIARPIQVQSVNGPAVTSIDGAGTHRCVAIRTNALFEGFSVTNGYEGTSEGGAGIYCEGGGRIRNCRVRGNLTTGYGGGIRVQSGGSVEGCTIVGNRTTVYAGGGIYVNAAGNLFDSVVQSNQAVTGGGGGSFAFGGGTIRNCLFLDNSSSSEGAGGLDTYNGNYAVDNCTICGNSANAGYAGGAEMTQGAMSNCIVYFNTTGGSESNWNAAASASIGSTCTRPLPPGTGNRTNDPSFFDRVRGDYRLASGSACIDAGMNQGWMAGARDIEGTPRIINGTVDLGAYELTPAHYAAPNGGHIWPYATWPEAATNIQAAVDAAYPLETVWVSNGLYRSGAELVVTQVITVASVNGRAVTTIDGGDTHRCVNVATSAVLDGFTLTNGYASVIGGGAYLAGGGTIRNSWIVNCAAHESGGGVYVLSNGLLQACVLSANTATLFQAGAVYLRYGGNLSHCVLVSNAAKNGGAVYCDAGGSLTNCLIAGNRAWGSDGGGVVFAGGGSAQSCTIAGNTAATNGGGVWCTSGGALLNTIIYGNSATSGSNYFINVSGASFTNCAMAPSVGAACVSNDPQFVLAPAGNYRLRVTSPCVEAGLSQPWMSGAQDVEGSPRISGALPDIGAYEFHYTFVSTNGGNASPYDTWAKAATDIQTAVNVATNGYPVLVTNGVYTPAAEIYVDRPILVRSVNGSAVTTINGAGARRIFRVVTNAVLSGFTITNGYSGDLGGGVYLDYGATIQSSRVVNCVAQMFGGGIYVTRNSMVQDCTIRRNRANNNIGGGVYVAEGAQVDRCVIDSNQAPEGGGLCDQGGGSRNCLIINNLANKGGGVYLRSGGPAGTVESSTVCSNSANDSGGVFFDGVGTLRNSIVYYNSSSNYGGAGGTVQSCNTTPSNGTACVTGEPVFVGAGDYHLSFASPCLGAGTNQGWMATALDLDLGPRLVGPSVDIGAYELGLLHYVRLLGSWTPSSPYSTWNTAATNIQDALNACANGDMVVVTDGVHSAAAQVSVTQAVSLASVNGSGATTINGGRAHRCLFVNTNALIYGFTFTNGYADVGGGVYMTGGGVIRDCVFATNLAGAYGGGAFISGTGVIQNCRLVGNTAITNDGGAVYFASGGTLLNCVVVSNSGVKGGAFFFDHGGLARNCLVAGNRARGGPQPAWGGGLLFYHGGGIESCTISDNTGTGGGGGIYGDGGGAGYVENSIVFFNTGGTSSNYSGMPAKYWTNNCTAPSVGAACVASDPLFADRTYGNYHLRWGSPCLDSGITEDWMADGKDLDNDLRIWNNEVDIGAYELPIIHVATDGDSVPPYTTWGDAATNPVDAASVKRAHCAIWVADGTYPISAQISLTGRVTFVSVNGAANTTIRGNGATRCFDIGYGSCVIDGLTIEGGVAHAGNGGAVYITRGGSVQNCIIRSNRASLGGAIFCFASGVVDRCTLVANTATNSGAGAVYLLAGGLVKNCLVYSNTAVSAAGIYLGYGTGMVQNCTVVRNIASDQGGGIYCGPESRVENTIAWFNIGSPGSNHYESGLDIAYTNCCTAPAIGTACVDSDPRFANLGACDFHIGTNSPCVDTGIDAMGVTNDFDGMMRPLDGNRDGAAKWDIGAYEAMNIFADTDGNGMPDGWEYEHYGWPVSGANPNGHDDGDGVNNLDESIADTDPRDSTSFLSFTNIFCDGEWRTLQFRSSANRLYTLQCSTNPAIASSWTNGGYVDQRGNGSTRSWKETNAPVVADRILVELP